MLWKNWINDRLTEAPRPVIPLWKKAADFIARQIGALTMAERVLLMALALSWIGFALVDCYCTF